MSNPSICLRAAAAHRLPQAKRRGQMRAVVMAPSPHDFLFKKVLTFDSYNRTPAEPHTGIARAGFIGKKPDKIR
jgi:hypothetical protein